MGKSLAYKKYLANINNAKSIDLNISKKAIQENKIIQNDNNIFDDIEKEINYFMGDIDLVNVSLKGIEGSEEE